MKLTLDLIYKTTKNLHHWFAKTPIEYSKPLSDLLKVPVIFKCEYLQPSGSAKLRGAYILLSTLTESQRKQGVAVCCCGDEAIAIAYVASLLNIPCDLYTPSSLSSLHKQKILSLGAHLHIAPYEHLHIARAWSQAKIDKQQTLSLHNNPLRIAGSGGSLALELIKDIPQLKHVIVPVGEGDMMAGLTLFFRKKRPAVEVIGCEHAQAPALTNALANKEKFSLFSPTSSIAQEISSHLCPLALTTLSPTSPFVSLHQDEEILEGMRWMLKHHQCLVDPSAALAIASCLQGRLPPMEGPTAVILPGKNVDSKYLHQLLRAT